MKYLIALALLAMPLMACAQQDYPRTISFCWTNPTLYEDDTLIGDGELQQVRIEVYRQNDATPLFTAEFPATTPGAEQCETLTGAIPQPGTYTGYGYAQANNLWSVASNPSDPRKYTGKPRPPDFTRTFE